MKQSWTKGLEPEATKEVKAAFAASALLRRRLVVLLHAKEKTAIRSGRTKEGYDCPNWAYKQADAIGYTRAINDLIELIVD